MFYELTPDVYAVKGITRNPTLPGYGTTFFGGKPITQKLPQPLVFESSFTKSEPPRTFLGASIPVWSPDFVELLRRIGVNNFECFDAIIKGKEVGEQWDGYFAVNVFGHVAAASLSESKFVEIMRSPGGMPFAGFTELVLDGEKARPFDLFRLAEDASVLIASQRVFDALKENPRPGGWGISAIPVKEV